jgi:hypothetical protein
MSSFTFALSVLTPPLSGPFCAADCFAYPFADIAGRFPPDYYWMAAAMVLTPLFVAYAACLHQLAPESRRASTLTGLAYGFRREYRFEVAAISIDWLVLLIAGTLSALVFRRLEREDDGKA